MNHSLVLIPRDPVIARDGRPFGDAGLTRQHTLPWPLPSTIVGSIRTLLGYQTGQRFDGAFIDRLKSLSIQGPFPVSGDSLFLPAPCDALQTKDGRCVRLEPMAFNGHSGTDLPAGLSPVVPPAAASLQKFSSPPAWWSVNKIKQWLLANPDPDFFTATSEFRQSAAVDERTHVKIEPKTFAAEKHKLFSTQGLVLDRLRESGSSSHESQLACTVTSDDSELNARLSNLHTLQPVGGERRVAEFQINANRSTSHFDCPAEIATRLNQIKEGDGLRMVLATPALFSEGWRPGWLNEDNGRTGNLPLPSGGQLRLRLTAVCNQRWDALSGWSYEFRGPKEARRMVPAGGVYFFEVLESSSVNWSSLWLQSVSDDRQDRRDGFGLAILGPG